MLEVTNGYTAKIEQVVRHKLLGLTINEDLNYEVHVDELCNKLFKRLGLLRHIGPYLKKNQRIIFFNAVFKPLMMLHDIQAQYGHRAIKCYLREFSEYKNEPRALFYMPLALVEQI